MDKYLGCLTTFTVAKTRKQSQVPICSNMDGLGGHYAKWNKSVRERQTLCDITYMGNLKKNDTDEHICWTETDS